LKLVIECKKSSNAFVVLCDKSDEKPVPESVIFKNLWTGSRDHLLLFAAVLVKKQFQEISQSYPTNLLDTKIRCGYTLLQAHQKSDSNIYSDIYGLVKAYDYEVQKELKFRKKMLKSKSKRDRKEEKKAYYVCLPVLVVDAPLVEVFLKDTGDLEVNERDIIGVAVRLPWQLKDEDGFGITILAKNKITEFANDMINLIKLMAEPQIIDKHWKLLPPP